MADFRTPNLKIILFRTLIYGFTKLKCVINKTKTKTTLKKFLFLNCDLGYFGNREWWKLAKPRLTKAKGKVFVSYVTKYFFMEDKSFFIKLSRIVYHCLSLSIFYHCLSLSIFLSLKDKKKIVANTS